MSTFTFVTKMVGGVFCAAGFAVLATGHAAAAEPPTVATTRPLAMDLPLLAPTVSIACATSGGSQELAKTPVIKNTASVKLAKGTSIAWKANDGDAGKLVLDADLEPGATVKAFGTKPGNAYSCSASYVARPDLVIKRAYVSAPMTFTIEVANQDPYADAAPSKVRLAVGLCQGNLSQVIESSPVAIGKGQTKMLTLSYGAMFGDIHFVVTADSGKNVVESFESNNVFAKPLQCT